MKRVEYNPQDVRTLTLEIPLTALPANGVKEYSLGSNTELRSAKGIISVEAFNNTLVSKGYKGDTNAADALYKCTSLTLVDGANQVSRNLVPLASLIRSNGNAQIQPMNLWGTASQPNPCDPERSKITIGDASTGTANHVVILQVTYVK